MKLSNMGKAIPVAFIVGGLCSAASAQKPSYTQVVAGKTTTVTVAGEVSAARVNPMIYGQMLEDCNDAVIYGGVVDEKGNENAKVAELLKALRIPVMRWPAGTAIYDYEWRNGIGPKEERSPAKELAWGGTEYYTFGTDEFIQWCGKIGAEPYINICMGNTGQIRASLGDAVDWVEYVNGPATSRMGALRATNGHPEPYNVRFWCLGNENYLGVGPHMHKAESAEEYSDRLAMWAKTLKCVCPELSLLGVGHVSGWNRTVMDRCGDELDYLTLHYYLTSQVKDNRLVDPRKTLFATARVEENLKVNIKILEEYNAKAGREGNPLRFSVDEWNNRHQVFDGEKYSFTRKDDRRQYDVSSTACMLNVFIRNSPHVAMANYIFPVNGHGLLKTVGTDDAYKSCNYHVFDLYRRFMSGHVVGLDVEGPGEKGVGMEELRVEGDNESSVNNAALDLCYVDCAATVDDGGALCISLVNRSYGNAQKVKLDLPSMYQPVEAWGIESDSVLAANTTSNRDLVTVKRVNIKKGSLTIKPCGLVIVRCAPIE